MWYYALLKQSSLNVAYADPECVHAHALSLRATTNIIAILIKYLCGATSTIHIDRNVR